MLSADHLGNLIPPRTPKAQVAAELSPRAWTLQEQYPGARPQTPLQKEAHTKRSPRPCWMDDGTHADANKAEAAPFESRTLSMSLQDCQPQETFVPTKLRKARN